MSYRRWSREDVISDMIAVAGERGVHVSKLSRAAYRNHGEGRASSKVFERQGGFAVLRAAAANDNMPLPAIPAGHHIKGASTLLGPDGSIKAQWVKTKAEAKLREDVLREMLEELPATVTPRRGSIKPPKDTNADLLAVYPMGDPHIGMLAWGEETGEDWDLSIAQRVMEGAIDDLVQHEPQARHALICNLGDFFHSDSQENRTARSGHQLDVDGRWSKVLRVGLDVMIYTIDRALEAHERVHVINEIGNHDDHSAIFLSVSLDAYYRNEPRVTIDLSPSRFHYYRHGDVFIGVTHGDGAKAEKLGQIMATDRAKDWGETRHRFWYCGHIHHHRSLDVPGCTVESFRTLAAKDAYAANAGYRSGRDMHRIILHRNHGQRARSMVTADYLRAMWEAA